MSTAVRLETELSDEKSRGHDFGIARRRTASVAAVAAIAAVLAIAPLVMPVHLETVAVFGLVVALLGLGVSATYSYLGVVFFGAAGFAAVGVYVTLITLSDWEWPLALAILAAAATPALLAVLLAPVVFRLSGIYFALLTFAIAEVIRQLIGWGSSVTGGQHGKTLSYRGSPLPFVSDMGRGTYWFAVLAVVVTIAALLAFRHSRIGLRAIALGDDGAVGSALGIRARPYQVGLFAACGFICGLAGFTMAFNLRFVEPSQFGAHLSISALTVLIVGGARVVPGAVIGAIVIVVLPEFLEVSPLVRTWIYGGGLIVTILVFKDGIGGTLASALRPLLAKLGQRSADKDERPD